MQDHPEVPKLPKLPFIASDVFLLSVAGFIAYRAPTPLEGGALVAIVTCVVVGAILLGIPFIAEYGRRTDVLLRERQDEIAALAKTTAACVEQVSIATASLHGLAESHARSARTLEALPQKLQEKVAEFKTQLNEISVAENEALEQELQTLRTAESDRLQSAVDELAKLSREFVRIEAAANQISTTLLQLGDQSAAKVTSSFTQAAQSATKEIESTFTRARTQWVNESKETQASALSAWSAHTAETLRQLEATLAASDRRSVAPVDSARPAKSVDSTGAKEASASTAQTPLPPAVSTATVLPASSPSATTRGPVVNPVASTSSPTPSASPAEPAAPSRPTAAPKATPTPASPTPELPLVEAAKPAPADVSNTKVPAAAPAVPAPSETAPTPSSIPAPAPAPTPAPAPARRGVDRNPDAAIEAALSSDGATRLLVTAYIGIGNKLFARGSGPGLSWEKGVPLHFVSIGKWRWDTPDATGPVQIKLYKNDQVECASLGTLELEPGHQHEVTATF
jgi:hypothetical protein